MIVVTLQNQFKKNLIVTFRKKNYENSQSYEVFARKFKKKWGYELCNSLRIWDLTHITMKFDTLVTMGEEFDKKKNV